MSGELTPEQRRNLQEEAEKINADPEARKAMLTLIAEYESRLAEEAYERQRGRQEPEAER